MKKVVFAMILSGTLMSLISTASAADACNHGDQIVKTPISVLISKDK